MPDAAKTIDQVIALTGKINSVVMLFAGVVQAIRALQQSYPDTEFPPTPTLQELLELFDGQRTRLLAANEAWFRDHGRDPHTGAKI